MKILDILAVQYKNPNELVYSLKVRRTNDSEISIVAESELPNYTQIFTSEKDLEKIIIQKLLSGEHIPEEDNLSVQRTCNKIAQESRRGSGNVIILPLNSYKLKEIIKNPNILIAESEFIPREVRAIVLYRAPKSNTHLKDPGVDGSPILVLNNEETGEYCWVGEEDIKKYVKVIIGE